MKVLQINTTVNSGSTGRIAEDIGKVLMNNQHESYIAFGRGNHQSQSQKIRIGTNIDVNLHGALTLLTDRHGFGSVSATKKLIHEIDVIQPDVIGLHNIHGYYINIEILFNYIAQKNIPVVWTLHDCWPFTGHCSHFDSVNCEKWKTQCENCPKTSAYPKSLGIDNSFKNYSDKKYIFNQLNNLQIVTPSHWLKNLVAQSFLGKYDVTCIHNGVDINVFKPIENSTSLKNKLNIPPGKKIVLGVANVWQATKGLTDFMKLSELLSENYQIVLIGLTKKQKEELPKNIIGLQKTESIIELASYYSLADVFVNPTYQDNFPTTNIEALACGTPVITYNTGGSPEAIDFETGEVVQKGEIILLKKAIEKWCFMKNAATVNNCRTRAVNFFTKEPRYLEYLNLYQQITTKRAVK